MGFSIYENQVRVDRFKSSGKFYTTYELRMDGEYHKDSFLHDEFKKAWERKYPKMKLSPTNKENGFIICLNPYHENSYPICWWLE